MKAIKIYSITDWKYHKGRVSWDDLFYENGKFLLTIATMDMAKEDGYLPDIAGKNKEPIPKRIFIQEKDKSWTVYGNVKYFTPRKVQDILDDLGRIIKKRYIFRYGAIPEWWKYRLTKTKETINRRH